MRCWNLQNLEGVPPNPHKLLWDLLLMDSVQKILTSAQCAPTEMHTLLYYIPPKYTEVHHHPTCLLVGLEGHSICPVCK